MYEPPTAAAGLRLLTLITEAGLNPREVVVVRNGTGKENKLKRVMPWLVGERPDLFQAYQAVQYGNVAASFRACRYLISFLGHGLEGATFAQAYEIVGETSMDDDAYLTHPANLELFDLGMKPDMKSPKRVFFDLRPISLWEHWRGRLNIVLGGRSVSWCRRADGASMLPVVSIVEEDRFSAQMPPWSELLVSWAELALLPASWKARLAEWRGIYFIFDTARQQGYVGSAYGPENILGRWRNYGDTGHGGNGRLRQSRPEDLRFSILQRTSPDMPLAEVVQLEAGWKARLHTRAHGLNAN